MLDRRDAASAPALKRVLHVVGVMNRGGAETMLMNVYRTLDREQLQFDFAVSTTQPGHFDDEIRELGGRILAHPNPAGAGMRAYRAAFIATLQQHGPFAAVHSHVQSFSGVVLEASFRAGVRRRIAHSHSVYDGQRDTLSRRAYRMVMRQLLRRYATHLLGCSPQACEALYGRRCWQDPRVAVVTNGVSLHRFGSGASRAELRRTLGLPSDAWLVGHVGSFTPAKNHETLIAIFASLRTRRPEAHLVLIGEGPRRAEIAALVAAHALTAHVHFLGVRSDVPELMTDLDAFMLPSRWEGFPVVLVEAQAAGLPCVVSDVVSDAVDVGLGLVRFVNLGAPTSVWADALIDSCRMGRPDRLACAVALKSAGFDAVDVSRRLSQTYA